MEIDMSASTARIYPWLKVYLSNAETLDDNVVNLDDDDSPIMSPWLGNLFFLYVFDTGQSFTVLQKRHLPPTISVSQLHEIAVSNLSNDVEFKLQPSNFGGYMLTAGGDHEAGSVSSSSLWKSIADHVGDDLIVSVPTKDLVLIVPLSNEQALSDMTMLVASNYATWDRQLTSDLFMFKRESSVWTVFQKQT